MSVCVCVFTVSAATKYGGATDAFTPRAFGKYVCIQIENFYLFYRGEEVALRLAMIKFGFVCVCLEGPRRNGGGSWRCRTQ